MYRSPRGPIEPHSKTCPQTETSYSELGENTREKSIAAIRNLIPHSLTLDQRMPLRRWLYPHMILRTIPVFTFNSDYPCHIDQGTPGVSTRFSLYLGSSDRCDGDLKAFRLLIAGPEPSSVQGGFVSLRQSTDSCSVSTLPPQSLFGPGDIWTLPLRPAVYRRGTPHLQTGPISRRTRHTWPLVMHFEP